MHTNVYKTVIGVKRTTLTNFRSVLNKSRVERLKMANFKIQILPHDKQVYTIVALVYLSESRLKRATITIFLPNSKKTSHFGRTKIGRFIPPSKKDTYLYVTLR